MCHFLSLLNENYKKRGQVDGDAKTILITGGSRGLGLNIAKNSLLYLKVKKVLIIDVIEPVEKLDEDKLIFYKCDISNIEELDKVILEIYREHQVNVLINNAGVRHSEGLNELTQDQIDRVFNVNTFSTIHLLRRLTKGASKLHIITIASILGTVGPKNLSIYSASKAATIQVHESLSYELKDKENVRFTLFLPGQLDTDMFKEVKVTKSFLAPIVDANKLSLKIIEVLQQGKRGIYCYPLYCYVVPLLKCLPFGFYEFLRNYSDMDNQIK